MDVVQKEQLSAMQAHLISPIILGYLVMGVILFIWSGFALTSRAIGASALTVADVALIRFLVPLILLIPFIPSHFSVIKQVRKSDLLFILLGGIPFLFLASFGAKLAPTAYVGAILAATPPFFVAILSYIFYRQLVSIKRFLMLSIIMIGILIMVLGGLGKTSMDMLYGIGFLLGASLAWAGYILALKRAALSAISVAIILSYISFFILSILMLTGIVESNIGSFSLQDALPFLLVQGLGIGVVATIGFSYVVNQLGPIRTSTIGALSPGLTALLAVPIFGEPLSVTILLGMSLTITGVILSNRVYTNHTH